MFQFIQLFLPLYLYETVRDCTYRQIFGGSDLKHLCWTENQILVFCSEHRELLREDEDGIGTLFLFEREFGGLLIANVYTHNYRRLRGYVHPLVMDAWITKFRQRIVIPQIVL